ncbi:hypothetical protein A2772_01970 [Candidatus Daviesbacteria bacterium RIFCSPHIGHO2_01_FULL_38_8b]|nr:MAG: hypothetical protein A2772_01970 [Candidatus Daviesbacteria bacterium RIFCSPHIGHO2_01_FULL_38_8b]
MERELYEKNYKDSRHFSFGKNWQSFLKTLNEGRIREAEKSLISFLGDKENITGKTFVDIGCGSGLFSLAAYLLGAKKIISVDIDDTSVACTRYLHEKNGKPEQWEIRTGSALNQEFLKSLGTFDIVYSWGVLHHTGNMYQALENITALVASEGKLYVALYNDNQRFMEGTSNFWLKVKKRYNKSSWFEKKIAETLYTLYYVLGLMFNLINPFTYIKNYSSLRGMNFMTDIKDWIGGYPYEFATPGKIVHYFKKRGFVCVRHTKARSIGCNEFLLIPQPAQSVPENIPGISVVIPVYNSETTIDQCIASVLEQTYQKISIICINDASTDRSLEKLLEWQKKYGSEKIIVSSNEKNLGVTKSLNRGIALVNTPFIARIDSDDWWDQTKIAKQIDFLEINPEYKIVGCNYININGLFHNKVITCPDNETIRKKIIKRNPFAHSCVVYTTQLVKQIGGYDESVRYGSDYDLYLRMFPFTKFHNLQEFLCFRTIQPEGISIKKQREQMLQGVRTQMKFIRRYKLSQWNYLYMTELLAVAYTPKIIRTFKRFLLG